MHLSVNDLVYDTKNRITLENQIYKTILYDAFHKIKDKNKSGKFNLCFRLPHVVYGNPSYDIRRATYHVVNELTKGGFVAIPEKNATIYIDWSIVKEMVNTEDKQKRKHVRFLQ